MTFPSCQSEQCYNETYWLKFCSRPQRKKGIDVGWRKCECGIQEAGRSPLMTGFWRLGQKVFQGGWDGSIYNGGSQTCQVFSCYGAFSMLSTICLEHFSPKSAYGSLLPISSGLCLQCYSQQKPFSSSMATHCLHVQPVTLLHAYSMALTLLENRLCICWFFLCVCFFLIYLQGFFLNCLSLQWECKLQEFRNLICLSPRTWQSLTKFLQNDRMN